MPRLFRIGKYKIYFWVNEGQPTEPVHVHVSEGNQTENATKIWLTSEGKCKLAHNNSKIPTRHLYNIMRLIEQNAQNVLEKWKEIFGEVRFYC